jgi:PEP-CTERM motif
MRFRVKAAVAAVALMASTPAWADIVDARASESQGTLVHGNGGAADVGTDVTGTLGGGPGAPEIVHFTGDTTATGTVNDVMLQQGAGQAELTGAIISGNGTEGLVAGDIFLTGNAGMEWIELAFQDVTSGTIEFTLSALDSGGNPETDAFFSYLLDPNGENMFAFQALNGEVITNLAYNIVGGTAGSIRQVRIASTEAGVPPVPEPATWAMMLLGFAAVGYSMRRSRKTAKLLQVA